MITFNAYCQTKEETIEYINTKQKVYRHKNNEGDIFVYNVSIQDTDNIKQLVIVEVSAIAGTIIYQDAYYVDIKNIIAVENSINEIGQKTVLIFAKNPGFKKLNYLDNVVSYETDVVIRLSNNTDNEQLKSLVKSYKYLIKTLGGKDLLVEKF